MRQRSVISAMFLAVAVLAGATAASAYRSAPTPSQLPAARVVATPVPTPTPRRTPTPTPTPAPGTPAPTRTVAPVPTPTPEPPKPDPRVRKAQAQLRKLGYWMPAATGFKDAHYSHAITALQKVAGLPRNGILDTRSKKALAKKVRPKAKDKEGDHVEIDVERQVLFFFQDKKVRWIFDSSTGKSSTPTVKGSFKIYKQHDGLRVSRLGRLWRPKYFYRGQAIHGYTSVPPYPASHGCVRVTYAAMDWIWAKKDLLPSGAVVLIY